MPENVGHVVQISGPAVDVQFAEATIPPIYEALKVVSDGFTVPSPINVVLEVQQHLGEGRVRCVAMEATEGMVRDKSSPDIPTQEIKSPARAALMSSVYFSTRGAIHLPTMRAA